MSSPQAVNFDQIRSLAFGSISGSYAAVGTATTKAMRLVCITNATDGDMMFSIDGTNNFLFVAAGSFKLFDFCANRQSSDEYWLLPSHTQFYVKQVTAPSKNSVYIECLWGQ